MRVPRSVIGIGALLIAIIVVAWVIEAVLAVLEPRKLTQRGTVP
jgi:hypothetical protein